MFKPEFHGGRIGYCSESACPSYDGKRCRLTGFRPDRVCEPWLVNTLDELDELRKDLASRDFDRCMFDRGKY